jgi:L-histidine N-alpha-methyltransferase
MTVISAVDPHRRAVEDDVLAGLRAPRKRLPCRLLYDATGAALFEEITRLDAYYPAYTELSLLRAHAAEIASHVGAQARVVEPGSGEALKSRIVLAALERPAAYVPIDISREQLASVAVALRAEFPGLEVQPVLADYTQPFALPPPTRASARTLVFFPGSTIGNFEPGEAREFLAMLHRLAGADGMLLLGADSTRDPQLLARAYDDEHGVTAAFNKNVLAHLNRTRGATFDLDAFDHRAVWNLQASRVEMQLVSRTRQIVRVDGALFAFTAGEPIVTEHCYKHTPEALRLLLATAGWRPRQVFTSSRVPFRLWLCEVTSRSR